MAGVGWVGSPGGKVWRWGLSPGSGSSGGAPLQGGSPGFPEAAAPPPHVPGCSAAGVLGKKFRENPRSTDPVLSPGWSQRVRGGAGEGLWADTACGPSRGC